MHGFSSLSVVALAAGLAGQGVLSYPQDTTVSRRGQAIALGTAGGSSQGEEGRWQQLIPPAFLPTAPSVIRGIAVARSGILTTAETVEYRTLRITLSHLTETELGTTFDDNLPDPKVVFDHTDYVRTWQPTGWDELLFDTPFAYDGSSGLVLEFRKEVFFFPSSRNVFMNVPGNPGRPDLPLAVTTAGAVGSGAANRNLAEGTSPPLSMRLLVDTTALSLLSNPVQPPFGNTFTRGSAFEVTLRGQAGTRYCTWVASELAPRRPFPNAAGAAILMPMAELPARTIDVSGIDVVPVTIPRLPTLVGVQIVLQAGAMLPNGQLTFTNGSVFFINGDTSQ